MAVRPPVVVAVTPVHRTTARWGLTRTECQVGPKILVDRPVPEPPPLTSSDFPCGPATLRGRVQSMSDGFGGAFKFRPLDKDDAVPRVRKAEEWELRRPWPSVHVQRRCAPTRPNVKRGPNSPRPPRAGTPALPLIRFRVLGRPGRTGSGSRTFEQAFQIMIVVLVQTANGLWPILRAVVTSVKTR